MLGDVRMFHRFGPFYDWVVPGADADRLAAGLAYADRPVERLLDVGGGTGRGARALTSTDPVVVDAARGMLETADGHGLTTVQGNAGQLPVPDDAVDAVLIVDALHHFGDADAAIREAARVLRPGGVLVIREFDPTTLRGRALVAAEHLVGFASTFYSADELAAKCRAAGLTPHAPERGFGYTLACVAG